MCAPPFFPQIQKREDADRALEALDGIELHGLPLTIGWGKAVPLPATPCWPPPGGLAATRDAGAAIAPPRGRGSSGRGYDREGR